ncbi:MAG: hypothetical protein SV765_05300 [Pseudomonadota bacterium]|nr:hypothetical protein [Pseudomonadota bacterium]
MPDLVIPVVFPDYLIAVNTPKKSFEIPDLIPGVDLLPDRVVIPETRNKVPELGHAGVLFIDGAKGTTKYYEYGRYAPGGIVRKLTIRNVQISAGGHPTKASLSYTLSQISAKAGQNGRISGAYIEVPGKYQAMLAYATKRQRENSNPARKPYDLFSNSCNHFMKGVMEAAAVNLPGMIDPRPNSYIEEIRDLHRDLDYTKSSNHLQVENPPESLAWARGISQPAAA